MDLQIYALADKKGKRGIEFNHGTNTPRIRVFGARIWWNLNVLVK